MACPRDVKRTRVCRVTRTTTLPDQTGACQFLHFTIDGLARRARFADPGTVPPFEGDVAYFEMEQRAKTRLGYVFVRQVEKPAGWTHWV